MPYDELHRAADDARLATYDVEFDRLHAALDEQLQRVGELTAERETLAGQVAALTTLSDSLQAQVSQLGAENQVLRDRVAELEDLLAGQPDPGRRTVFGACPANPGGTSLAAAQTVVGKFGAGVAVRQFLGSLAQVAQRPADAGITHHSWKPTSVAQITDAAVQAACVNLRPGDVVEVWHEVDKKVRDGVFTRSEGVARKNAFFDCVGRVRPDLYVANTLTGWEFVNPATRGQIDGWADVKAHVIGADLDGINPTSGPYPDYRPNVAAVTGFLERAKAKGYRYWAVPEFNAKRQASDGDAARRTAWARDLAGAYDAAGALYVAWFDYSPDSDGLDTMTLPTEVASWQAIVPTIP
jgi:hypothetical protein